MNENEQLELEIESKLAYILGTIPASCEKIGDLDFVKFSLGEYEHTLENSQYIYDADELVVRCSKCGHELEVIRVLQE